MGATVRAELLKLFTTPVVVGMAIAIFVGGADFAVLFTSDSLVYSAGGPGGIPTDDALPGHPDPQPGGHLDDRRRRRLDHEPLADWATLVAVPGLWHTVHPDVI